MDIKKIIMEIKPLSEHLSADAQKKIDGKTKPRGSLGRLEDCAVRLCRIQNTLSPQIQNKALFVFAADHGIAGEGVSAYPPEVTPQMVLNFLSGGAAINVLCRQQNIDIKIIDAGVNFDFFSLPEEKLSGLINKKIRPGTGNFLKEPAMTMAEAEKCLAAGAAVVKEYLEKNRADVIGLGDMGIGNTASSSAIISAVTGISPAEVTGRGTGIDDQHLKQKADIIAKALIKHKPDARNAFDILSKVGGFEIGAIAGAALFAASKNIPVVLDGIISTAGGLIAGLLNPSCRDYFFSGHQSVEKGQKAALAFMNLEPLLDLNLRLGEGTGAALAMHLLDASCRIMSEMASFEEAGVSKA
ncbi:MAG: nicotinate-nucleotide--dimethylbenzimidazole phosphoribosyltransferase [Spirochaetes bacterium GWF1_41_5]|nr:MAG: nicotinate-nucleotide--dimethylbenzimidazole phosphoribosyltransferase [Spirochaetes bacterium GWF1_41_5]